MADEITVAELPRSTGTTMVRLCQYNGYRYVDIRVFIPNKENTADVPTRKGITIAPGSIKELIAALRKAEQELSKGSSNG